MKENKNKVVIVALIAVVVLLLGIIAYTFLLQPALTGFVAGEQSKGVQYGVLYAISTIMQQGTTCQQVPLTNGNQTMNFIWVDCLNQAAAQQTP